MQFSRVNTSAATLTKNRTDGSVSPVSGMCVTCVDGCIGMCEIGKSAYRGHEVIYPQPFGMVTTAAEKTYPVDYSHFNIMGTAVGAHGIEADSDKAIFPAVNLEVVFGQNNGIKFRYPWGIPGIGSTNIAKNNIYVQMDLWGRYSVIAAANKPLQQPVTVAIDNSFLSINNLFNSVILCSSRPV